MIRLNLVEITDKWAANSVLNPQQCLDSKCYSWNQVWTISRPDFAALSSQFHSGTYSSKKDRGRVTNLHWECCKIHAAKWGHLISKKRSGCKSVKIKIMYPFLLSLQFAYRMRAIITSDLYIFYPIFHCGL